MNSDHEKGQELVDLRKKIEDLEKIIKEQDEHHREDEFGIIDTGIDRVPRMAATPWSGEGDYNELPSDTGTSVGIGTGTSVGIGTGTSVGIGTGTSVGIGTGTSVGIGTGTSVGIGTGTSVGIGTGTSVGIGTGTSVGIGTGTSVGIGTGTSVGIGTGTSVGIGTGTSVGIGTGTSVGIGTGTSVGIGTGTSVGIGTATSVGVGANIGSGSELGASAFIDTLGSAANLRHALLQARHQLALRKEHENLVDEIKSRKEDFEALQYQIENPGSTTQDGSKKKTKSDEDRLEPRDLWRTVRHGQPVISPCGKWVAFVKRERFEGGILQYERIFVKRYGTAPGIDEYPVTDGTILADTPVWEPPVFDCFYNKSTKISPSVPKRSVDTAELKIKLLFRARLTQMDVMQLYIVDLELPSTEGVPLRIGQTVRLTNAPSHPWSPKWRRFRIMKEGDIHSRIYFVAGSTKSDPIGYDHLVFDDALVGWWNSLVLPHRHWRFYEIDAESPDRPRDLLGPNQPLLDFIHGVWTCWDVHPGGDEIVWAAVDENDYNNAESGWPRDVVVNLWSMPIQKQGKFEPVQMTRYLSKTGSREGRRDSYAPCYSPGGESVVFAERQFSPSRADFPKLSVIYRTLDAYFKGIEPGEQTGDSTYIVPDEENTFLPVSWRFQNNVTLMVQTEVSGRLVLHRVNVRPSKAPPPEGDPLPAKDYGNPVLLDTNLIDGKSSWQDHTWQKENSIHDFDVSDNGDDKYPRVAAVNSAMTEPPELSMLIKGDNERKWEASTNDNDHLTRKLKVLTVKSDEVEQEQEPKTELSARPYSLMTFDKNIFKREENKFQLWVVLPSSHPKANPTSNSKKDGEKYPLVQLLHGGPNASWLDEFHMRFNASFLASHGYVVGMVNFRGSTGVSEMDALRLLPGAPPVDGDKRTKLVDFGNKLTKFRRDLLNNELSSGTKVGEYLVDIIREYDLDPARKQSGKASPADNREIDGDFFDSLKRYQKLIAVLSQQGRGWEIFRRLERHASPVQYRKLLLILRITKKNTGSEFYPYFEKQLVEDTEDKKYQLKDKLFEKLVNRPNLRSSVGWDGYPLDDVQAATSKLIKDYHVDKNRMALIGGSYGAYLGARMLGWKKRNYNYKAAVLHAGVYDPLSFFSTDAFWAQFDNFGARPWRRAVNGYRAGSESDDGGPEAWRQFSRISPLLRSHKLVDEINKDREDSDKKNPDKKKYGPAVLITHGLSDLRVPWQQSLLYHRMLIDHGGNTRLALYPGLGHRLDQPEPSVQWWTDTLKWLAKNDVPPGPKPK